MPDDGNSWAWSVISVTVPTLIEGKRIGAHWTDISGAEPVFKLCTSLSPLTWIPVAGSEHPDLAAHDTLGLATQAELDAHGHAQLHDAVTLETSLSTNLLSITAQQLALKSQLPNGYVFAQPLGAEGFPSFRPLEEVEIPTLAQSKVTNLITDLAAKVPTTRTVSTTAPLAGGGDLSTNRTLSVAAATTTAVGVVELATDGESAANVVVQGNDARLSNDRTPTTHDILTKHNGFPGPSGNTFLNDLGGFSTPAAVAGDLDRPETGSLTVLTAKYHMTAVRHVCTTTQRITVEGTGRLRIMD